MNVLKLEDDRSVERELRLARIETLRAALATITDARDDEMAGLLRRRYEILLRRAESDVAADGAGDDRARDLDAVLVRTAASAERRSSSRYARTARSATRRFSFSKRSSTWRSWARSTSPLAPTDRSSDGRGTGGMTRALRRQALVLSCALAAASLACKARSTPGVSDASDASVPAANGAVSFLPTAMLAQAGDGGAAADMTDTILATEAATVRSDGVVRAAVRNRRLVASFKLTEDQTVAALTEATLVRRRDKTLILGVTVSLPDRALAVEATERSSRRISSIVLSSEPAPRDSARCGSTASSRRSTRSRRSARSCGRSSRSRGSRRRATRTS